MNGKDIQAAVQDARREKLVAYVKLHFPSQHPRGNVSGFAEAIGKKQSQIADVLDSRKPFGEKLARLLEKLIAEKLVPLGMPELRFDVGREAVQTFYGIPLSREAVEFAADWARLKEPMRGVVRHLVKTNLPPKKQKVAEARKPVADLREASKRRDR
jgi:hypothetical protein